LSHYNNIWKLTAKLKIIIAKLIDALAIKVSNFEENFFETVVYDLETGKYERKKIDKRYNLIKMTLDGNLAYVYDKKNKNGIELSGNRWEKKRLVGTGEVLGVIKPNYIIKKELEMMNGSRGRACNIYDFNSLDLKHKIPGNAVVFEDENMVVIY